MLGAGRGRRLAGEVLRRLPGMRIVDLCAAPGGEAAELAAAALTSWPSTDGRTLKLLAANFARLRLNSEVVVADALAFERAVRRRALDALCSATGTIRRHPDVAWIKRSGDLARLSSCRPNCSIVRLRSRGRAAPWSMRMLARTGGGRSPDRGRASPQSGCAALGCRRRRDRRPGRVPDPVGDRPERSPVTCGAKTRGARGWTGSSRAACQGRRVNRYRENGKSPVPCWRRDSEPCRA